MIDALVCVLFDPDPTVPSASAEAGYDEKWADRLARGFWRHYRRDVPVVCLCDNIDRRGFEEPIETLPLSGRETGWGHIAEAWSPLVSSYGRTFWVALDTVFVGPLHDIVACTGPAVLSLDPNQREERVLANAAMIVDPGEAERLWAEWHLGGGPKVDGCTSEMEFLRFQQLKSWTSFEDQVPGQLASWKVDVRGREHYPVDARMIYFHGNPKQHALRDHDPIKQEWLRR